MYPNSTADSRAEKLLAAKKKLKQFQSRRRSTSRSVTGDSENKRFEDNDESRRDDYGKRPSRHYSKQAQDENADDRPLSECYVGYSTESLAESTASTTKATKVSRARRASAASSRYLETPEPIRVTVAPEQQDFLFRQRQERQQTTGAFFHDEQRSPFQRVKRDSEDSDTPTMSTVGAGGVDFALQNEYNLPSSTSAQRNYDNQQFEQAGGFPSQPLDVCKREESQHGLPPAAEVSLNILRRSREEGLFSNIDNTGSGNITDAPVGTAHQNSVPHDSVSRVVENSGNDGRDLLSDGVVNKAPFGYAEPAPADARPQQSDLSFQLVVHQQQLTIDQLNEQLEQLHNHYAQLHTAYSEIIQQHQQTALTGVDGKTGELDELRRQIQLHLHTMSVLVDEKTDLQSQLRQAMEIANQKHFENEELQGRLKANRERLGLVESELEGQTGTRRGLEDALRRQVNELERLRKESAQWQARASEAQQDRSEMNAKLKVRSREVDDLGSKLREAEKQLHLKDIYIQQLTGGAGVLQQQQGLSEELEQQRGRNAELLTEVDNMRKAIEQFRWDAEQSRERYEAYIMQLNENTATLSTRLECAERDRYDLQVRYDHLEKQAASLGSSNEENLHSSEELMNVKLAVSDLERDLKSANNAVLELQTRLTEKEANVTALVEQISERDRRIHQLNDQLAEQYQHDGSARNLLQELHNEKATASRAVAQNIDLKNQLAELQEKFVLMTETGMDTANKLESSERQLTLLKEKLDQKDNEAKTLTQSRDEELAAQRERINALMSQNFERSHMEDRLRHYEAVQKHFDVELERTQREIGHLKVENADLVQRLAILNDANRSLQTEREQLLCQNSQNEHKLTMDGSDLAEMNKSQVESLVESHGAATDSKSNIDELGRQLIAYEQELTEARHQLQHLTTENAELHRIMEQNAEDENQNTITVELRQALNRSTTLSNDNEQLRQRIAELEAQLTYEKSSKVPSSHSIPSEAELRGDVCEQHCRENNGDDHSSVCSEHGDKKRESGKIEAFENMKRAMDQLQQRFAKAMNDNADLSDQNQHLEHLIMQLQSETETIGEYITIYQHQRKTIRERLKEKEEYVARLAREKEDVQAKLCELQQLVVRLLRDKGNLRQYAQMKPVHGKPPSSPPSISPRKPRGLSQTLVDEVTGLEVSSSACDNEKESVVLLTNNTSMDHSNGDMSPVSENLQRSSSPDSVEPVVIDGQRRASEPSADSYRDEIMPDVADDDATAERILRLITEIRRPDLVNSLPPVERNLHCKYCTGRLIML